MIYNIIIFIIILILINYIVVNSNNTENLNNIDSINLKKRIPLYGDDQFTPSQFIYDDLKFQDIIHEEFNLEKPTEKKIPNYKHNYEVIDLPLYKGIYKKTELPSQSDIIYDTQSNFYRPSDEFDGKILDDAIKNTDFRDKSIKEVYESLSVDYKKIIPKKNLKKTHELIEGASGNLILPNVLWLYDEDENNNNVYDPSLSKEAYFSKDENIDEFSFYKNKK